MTAKTKKKAPSSSSSSSAPKKKPSPLALRVRDEGPVIGGAPKGSRLYAGYAGTQSLGHVVAKTEASARKKLKGIARLLLK